MVQILEDSEEEQQVAAAELEEAQVEMDETVHGSGLEKALEGRILGHADMGRQVQ